MSKNTTKKVAIGAGVAAAVGYVAGLLTAPKSGKETRDDIKNTAEKAVDDAEAQLSKLHSEVDLLVANAKAKGGGLNDKAKQELDKLVANVKDAKVKAEGIVSAVKKDEAADKDLKRAVAEAGKAVGHLRKYLSK